MMSFSSAPAFQVVLPSSAVRQGHQRSPLSSFYPIVTAFSTTHPLPVSISCHRRHRRRPRPRWLPRHLPMLSHRHHPCLTTTACSPLLLSSVPSSPLPPAAPPSSVPSTATIPPPLSSIASSSTTVSTTTATTAISTTSSKTTAAAVTANNSANVSAVPPSPTVLTIISTIVGVCVLIGSLLYKLPQLIRVIRRRSAAGISVSMYALETLGTTFSALYFARRSFPFSTYGENVFIMVQNVVLLALIVFYKDLPRAPTVVLAVLYVSMVIALLSPVVPLSLLVILQFCSIPILNLSRVPQIMLNHREKSTGQLSPITLALSLVGNLARVFTTIAQVRDPLMFVGICVATCFNTTLFGQWLYYSRRRRTQSNTATS